MIGRIKATLPLAVVIGVLVTPRSAAEAEAEVVDKHPSHSS
jgi:hypothetical protein